MTTLTDHFAGGGGTTTGAMQVPNVEVTMAANHLQLVMDIHAANHPNTEHAVVDLHQERPSFFPKTDMYWASPECTKWSQANGAALPAIEEGLFADPFADDAKTQSRLLMFDVLRYVEHHRYRMVMVENVVDIATQAKYRTAWTIWRQELRALGYNFRVVSLNSMHAQTYGAPVPQSRDRIYIVAWPEREKAPELERILRPKAYCPRCDLIVESVQSFKPKRDVGRYGQTYLFCCSRCGVVVEPGTLPAASIIDWSLRGERIGDRIKPKTRLRVAHGIAKWWGPLTIEAAGNTYDSADPSHPRFADPDGYYRAWSTSDTLRALHTTNSKALAVPLEAREGKEAYPVDHPLRTQTTRMETALAQPPFVAEMYGTSTARPVTEPAGTFTAGGNHHALVTAYYGAATDARPTDRPIGTLTTVDRYALIQRMNSGGAEMTTPADEYLRTLTAAGHQALLRQPGRPVSAKDLSAAMEMVSDTELRMFQPHEVAAGMGFPPDYIWQPEGRAKPISKRDLVRAMGNAVTPPSSRDIVQVAVDSLEAA